MRAVLCVLALAACSELEAGGPTDKLIDDDPLAIDAPAQLAGLDALYASVLQPTCASQGGACHAGQFEPNLSTPALAFANLVGRPGGEIEGRLRVRPGDPERSLLIDKLRHRDGVATRMPLGAEPLSEEVIQRFEAWIRDGAVRAPGAEAVPALNNPPEAPEVAVFDGPTSDARRLDAGSPVRLSPGDSVVLRHSAFDFETPAEDVVYAGFSIYSAEGDVLELVAGDDDPTYAVAAFAADAPPGQRRPLSYGYAWHVPETLTVFDASGRTRQISSRGQRLSVLAYYADRIGGDGISTYTVANDLLEVW